MTRVGVAGAVNGEVRMTPPGADRQYRVRSGSPVLLGAVVRTGSQGRLQILLLDETVFTIGPGSEITIDEFVYDPDSGVGEVAASISKGVFRFVSGKVARRDPEKMKVELPAGTIGVRGTSVAGRIDGRTASVVLLGPGPTNNAGERPGRVVVDNGRGEVWLSAPRFGTELRGGDAPPEPARRWSTARLDALTRSLQVEGPGPPRTGSPRDARGAHRGRREGGQPPAKAAPRGSAAGGERDAPPPQDRSRTSTPIRPDGDERAPLEPSGGGTPTRLAGQAYHDTLARMDAPLALGSGLGSDLLDDAGQDATGEETGIGVPNGPTSIAQLPLVPPGSLAARYRQEGVPLAAVSGLGFGSYDVEVVVDLGAREVKVSLAVPVYNLGGVSNTLLPAAEQTLRWTGSTGPASGRSDFSADGNAFSLGFRLLNAGGIPGAVLDHDLSIDDGAGNAVAGGGFAPLELLPLGGGEISPTFFGQLPVPPPYTLFGQYASTGVAMTPVSGVGAGSYDLDFAVDFGSRSFEVGVSSSYSVGLLSGSHVHGFRVDYGSDVGEVRGSEVYTDPATGASFRLDMQLFNEGGTVAALLEHELTIDDLQGNAIRGGQIAELVQTVMPVVDFADLRSLTAGSGIFTALDVPLVAEPTVVGGGSYDVQYTIDFANRAVTLDQLALQYDFGGSPRAWTHPGVGTVVLDYASLPDDEIAQVIELGLVGAGNDRVDAGFQILEDTAGGNPASEIHHVIRVEDAAGTGALKGEVFLQPTP